MDSQETASLPILQLSGTFPLGGNLSASLMPFSDFVYGRGDLGLRCKVHICSMVSLSSSFPACPNINTKPSEP